MPNPEAERRNTFYKSLVGDITPGQEQKIPFTGEFGEDKFGSFSRWATRGGIEAPPGYRPLVEYRIVEGKPYASLRLIQTEVKQPEEPPKKPPLPPADLVTPRGRTRFTDPITLVQQLPFATESTTKAEAPRTEEAHGLTGIVGKDGVFTPEHQARLDEVQIAAVDASMIYLVHKSPDEHFPLIHMATGIGKGKIIHELIRKQLEIDSTKPILLIIGTMDHLRDQMTQALSRYQETDMAAITQAEQQLRSNLLLDVDVDNEEDDEEDDELIDAVEDSEESTAIEQSLIEEGSFTGYTTGKYKQLGVKVQLSTIQKIQSAVKRGEFDPTQYGMVIVDEVHNLGTKPRKAAVDICKEQGVPVVGLTATAYRSSGAMRVPESYGFTPVISYPLDEAQSEKLLPPLYGLQFNTAELLKDYPIPTKENGTIDHEALEQLLKNHPELRSYVVDKLVPIITLNGNHYKTVLPVNYVWEAQEYAELLRVKGISVGLMINKQASQALHTDEIPTIGVLDRYKLPQEDPNSIQVLISPRLAGEGFDAPWTEVLCWGSITDSDLRYTQYNGRLARRHPGKAWGLVIDTLFQLDQFAWSMNMAQWMKGKVQELKNGLLYLGPLQEVHDLSTLEEMYKMTDPKSVEDLEQKIHNTAPEGWMVLGNSKVPNSLATFLGKERTWIHNKITSLVEFFQKQWDEQGVLEENRPKLFGEFSGKTGTRIYYSPLIIEELKKLAEGESIPPEDWYPVGGLRSESTIAKIINRSTNWIQNRIALVMNSIENNWDEQNIPVEDREDLYHEYLNTQGKLYLHYAPIVTQNLKAIADQESSPPDTWLPIGEKINYKSLSSILNRSPDWILSRVKTILGDIDSPDILHLEGPKLWGIYTSTSGTDTAYFSDFILEELRNIHDKELADLPPSDWLPIGTKRVPNSMSAITNHDRDWVYARLPKALDIIRIKWDEEGTAIENRPELFREYSGKTGKYVYYNPLVLETIQEIEKKEKDKS